MSPVVGRFAPSPTGPLHLGSLVAAVGSWLFARSAGGRWLVRIEDIDRPRVIPGMEEDILATLEALGLAWDGPVVRQSERVDLYEEAFERLVASGAVYPCGCTRAEVAAASSAPHAGEEGPPYPGTCREGLAPGRNPRSWRARTEPEEEFCFDDLVAGPTCLTPSQVGGDFVVRRADGVFAYQLAVVVDDALQGITQVVRGADLLSSTPRQLHLFRALGFAPPVFGHLPLVRSPDGGKLSKRDNAVSLAAAGDFAGKGGALMGRALHHLGQQPPEFLAEGSAAEALAWALANFTPGAIPRN